MLCQGKSPTFVASPTYSSPGFGGSTWPWQARRDVEKGRNPGRIDTVRWAANWKSRVFVGGLAVVHCRCATKLEDRLVKRLSLGRGCVNILIVDMLAIR